MIIGLRETQAMQQAYVTITHPTTHTSGYRGMDQELRGAALEVMAIVFPWIQFRTEDISVSCMAFDGNQIVFRAAWDPRMDQIELSGGAQDGRIHTLPYPHSTVTFRTDVRASYADDTESYSLAGFNTDTGRFVFRNRVKVA